jgi:hypothetical protein
MIKRGRGACLALEAFERVLVAGQLFGQELQCHLATELGVLGPVNDTHLAAPELLEDAVVRDGRADYGVRPCPACLAC